MEEEPPFYGQYIFRDRQQKLIEKILDKHRNEPVNDALKEKIWDELQKEKHAGNITIPFKLVMHEAVAGLHPPYIEVLLDTKV